MSETGEGGRRRGGIFDDLAGVAGGALSVLAGLRQEMEQVARTQADAMVQRLELVRREELDAALEVARRAREAQEAMEARVAALEERLGMAGPASPGPEQGSAVQPGAVQPEAPAATVPEGSPAATASAGMPGVTPEEKGG